MKRRVPRPGPAGGEHPGAQGSVLLLLLACLLLLAGCGRDGSKGNQAVTRPRRGGVLRVLSEPPHRLDPVAINEVYESVVLRQIYQGLISLDPGLRLTPCLATSWTVSPDGLLYTFRLRGGVRFHDGSRFSASDVVFSLHRALSPNRAGGCMAESYLMHIRGAGDYRNGRKPAIDGIRAPDDQTLTIELEHPLSIFLKVLAMDQTAVLPRSVFEGKGSDAVESHPIGTGPFRFERREPEGGVVVARFPEYWGSPSLLDTLIFRSLPREGVINEAQVLAAGKVDFASLSAGVSGTARELGLQVYRSPELSFAFLGMRLDRPPMNIPQVRRAILLAIEREGLQAADPEGVTPVLGLLPPGLPNREPIDQMPRPSPDDARRLLAEAGHPQGQGLPTITIGLNYGGPSRVVEDQIVRNLEAVGLKIRIQRMSWGELSGRVTSGSLQAFMMSWVADLPDPDAFLYPLFHSRGESNLFAYASAEVDSLLDVGHVLSSGSQRTQLYQRLQEVILRDAPMVPLYNSSIAYAWRPEVHGVELGPAGYSLLPFDQIYVDPPSMALKPGSEP